MVRVRHSRQWFHARAAGLAVLTVGVSLATGCKSGSWGAKPSWWSFGGSPPASSLTSAPSFDKDKDVVKPSEAAKPYPITNTPEGYTLSDATKTDAARTAAGPTAGLVEPTAVTYGTTPSPTTVTTPQATTTAPAVAGTSVGPQVGPYASLQPQQAAAPPPTGIDPATAATAGMAAAPAFGEASPPITQPQSAQPLAAQPPAARYADASASQAWPASPPPAAAPTSPLPAATTAPTQAIDGRYGESNSSRFGAPATGFTAPAAAPPITPNEPPVAPATSPAPLPGAGDTTLPGAIAPPRRRPDAGYRPAGTSSYQPGQTILAGEQPPATGVLPASFEAAPTAE